MFIRSIFVATAAGFFAVPSHAEQLPLPKAAYSADVVFQVNGQESVGHVNVDGPKERRDVKDAAARNTVKIIRRDLGKVYQLRPQHNDAVELRLSAAEASGQMGAPGIDVDAFYAADATPEDEETIAGLKTTRYHIKAESSPGLTIDTQVWCTADGIIVRVVGKTSVDANDKPAKMELSNVALGPQDSSLFEVPPGAGLISAAADPDSSTDLGAPPATGPATPPAR